MPCPLPPGSLARGRWAAPQGQIVTRRSKARTFASNDEFFAFVRSIGERLVERGFEPQAQPILLSMKAFYTTSSEAFGEIGLAIGRTMKSKAALPDDIAADLETAVATVKNVLSGLRSA